jgi:hypothetical protein
MSGCSSTTPRRYQEADDVYVTQSDMASERAEELAQKEMANSDQDRGDNEMKPSPQNEKAKKQSRKSSNGGSRVAWYVLGGLLEIAFNLLLIWLLW